jgi:O-succinylbenzoate synthase
VTLERAAALYRYRVPLVPGAALRHGEPGWREGLLLQLREGDREGWGEVAPLPGFSRESLAQAQVAACAWLSAWQARAPAWPDLAEQPALAFGSSCALAELADTLPAPGDYRAVPLYAAHTPLAALVPALQDSPVAKLKLGHGDPAREAASVSALFNALPSLELRLDANRAWTLAQALQFAHGLSPAQRQRIAFFEEPCQTPAQSLAFAQDSGIALAWDETLREPGFVLSAPAGLRALILKPSLQGSVGHCRQLIEQAQALGLVAVISASIESSLGLGQLARLAAWLTPQTRPGLDTLRMLQAQVLRPWPGSALPLLAQEDLECLWTR